jgi:phage/plasmid-like protein (TIGR03299 family)
MASEIERNEDLFYVEGDGTPWHGLGIPVVGALTADEAIVKAGQNWTVETHPAYAKIGDNFVRIPDTFSTVRMDTKSPFPGTVGGVYVPFQNRDAFAFFDEVVGNNQAKYVTAGCLRGGQRVWILAQVGKNFKIADSKDEMAKYVLLYNAHDGSSKVRMMLTPIRVV